MYSGNPLTPKQIVEKLDKYIIGQADAKRAVAIALRNRWRRQNVSQDLGEEIAPKNIIMIGPTGVGKTEIARRLAKIDNSPFLKIEASKFTEVGYVGRDVESMIRDLVELAINMKSRRRRGRCARRRHGMAEEKLLDVLLPPKPIEKNVEECSRSTAAEMSEVSGPADTPARNFAICSATVNWIIGCVELEVNETKAGPHDRGLFFFRCRGDGDEHQGTLRQHLPAKEKEAVREGHGSA